MASPPQGSSRKRSRPEWKSLSDDDEQQEHESKPTAAVQLTPHTLRLLRLLQEGTTDHAQLSASNLTSIAASSSPLVLWDILGRLVETLASSSWRCRYNASLAVEGIAKHIPPLDQEEFLRSNHHGERQQDSAGLWLNVSDLERPTDKDTSDSSDTIGLDVVIEKGRLLLASSGAEYDSVCHEQYQRETNQLRGLDASSGSRDDFVKQRVSLQRRILAQRLGFVGVLESVADESSFFADTITNEDLLDPATATSTEEESSSLSRRQQHMERINNRYKKEQDQEDPATVRALLVLEMDQQRRSSSGATSHRNPQTLLATEFIYLMFSPSWHVRHGALLGALALLRAWRVSRPNSGSDVFGVWPRDILARCICVLALDRFGDYSGSFDAGDDDGSPPDSAGVSSGCVVAPVREMAGQLLSLLLNMAPLNVRQTCLDLLFRMSRHPTEWEVRHGALLSMKYIAAVATVNTSQNQPDAAIYLEKISQVAVERLSDDSEDVQSVAAQALLCLIPEKPLTIGEPKSSFDVNGMLMAATRPLWLALAKVKVISAAAVDLVYLFSRFLCRDCHVVLLSLESPERNEELPNRNLETLKELLYKLVTFLDFHSFNVKLSTLHAISAVADAISTVLANYSTHDQREREWLGRYSYGIFPLLEKLFESYFEDAFTSTSQDSIERHTVDRLVKARDRAWMKLVDSFQSLFRNEQRPVIELLVFVILRYVGILWRNERTVAGGSSARFANNVEFSAANFQRVENMLASDSNELFTIRIPAAKVLAYLIVSLCEHTDSRGSSLVDVDGVVHVAILSLLQSPWSSLCEAACLLYKELCVSISKNERAQEVLRPSMNTCYTTLCESFKSSPFCLEVEAQDESDTVRADREVIAICDRALVGTLVTRFFMNDATSNGVSKSSAELTNIWKAAFKAKGIGIEFFAGGSIPASIRSVRVNETISGCLLPWGRRNLPSKLTPMIRSLMTSLKSETDGFRQRETCMDIVRLINLLSTEADLRVRDKVVENICVLAVAKNLSADPGTRETGHDAAALVLKMLVGELPSGKNLESFAPVWARLKLLAIPEQSVTEEVLLDESLRLLDIVSKSLRRNTDASAHLIEFSVSSLVIVACEYPSSNARLLALSTIESYCKVDATRTLENGFRMILKYLQDLRNDAYRLAGCSLLSSVIESAGMEICAFVRCLLPSVMSIMTDALEDCAKLASQSFAALIRVAPLVQRQTSKPLTVTDIDDGANKVIDHLIHGLPLPPCELPLEIRSELKKSGTTLRQYQAEGVAWLSFLQTVNLNGALCDDMGVGKTIQALVGVAISHDRASREGEVPRSLVVCPSTVVGHWVAEIDKFFPSHTVFRAMSFVGNSKQRKARWMREIAGCNVVVTSYSYLRSDIELLSRTSWSYCILDEGHLLKNPKTATAIASRRLRARHKLILTGTPVQNRVHELWAAFDFLMPSFLGTTSTFTKEFAKPITLGHLPDASADEIAFAMEKLKLLHQQVLPFILRREKGQVLEELPPKCITNIPCDLSVEQERLYRKICDGAQGKKSLELLREVVDGTTEELERLWEGRSKVSIGSEVLRTILCLRLVCTHPTLVAHHFRSSGDSETTFSHELTEGSYARLESSGKLLALNELLRGAGICVDELTAADNDTSLFYCDDDGGINDSSSELGLDWTDGAANDYTQREAADASNQKPVVSKCLIFAQFSQSLDVIENYLFVPHMASLRYLRMDGRTPLEERPKLVKRFNSDDSIKVMLLATRVGGLGLNLTGADTVIFFEHDWNPHVDLQAMDRCHRIGQTKSVNIYRIVTSNSIEEKVMKMQEAKLAVSDAIVNTDNSSMYSMGTDRLLDIFSFRGGPEGRGNGEPDLGDALYSVEEYSDLSVSEFMKAFHPDEKTGETASSS